MKPKSKGEILGHRQTKISIPRSFDTCSRICFEKGEEQNAIHENYLPCLFDQCFDYLLPTSQEHRVIISKGSSDCWQRPRHSSVTKV